MELSFDHVPYTKTSKGSFSWCRRIMQDRSIAISNKASHFGCHAVFDILTESSMSSLVTSPKLGLSRNFVKRNLVISFRHLLPKSLVLDERFRLAHPCQTSGHCRDWWLSSTWHQTANCNPCCLCESEGTSIEHGGDIKMNGTVADNHVTHSYW